MSGGQWMVVLIVAIVMIARIVRSGMRQENRRIEAGRDPEAVRLQEEVRQLKERLAVLERIATDDSSALDREIEALRDRPLPAPRGGEGRIEA
jgi:C4-dicarboxylate-specific signal transduction histidine kinase